MSTLRRYLPLFGVAGLVASLVLRWLGQTEASAVVDAAGQFTGAYAAAPIDAVELASAVAAGAGVVLKVVAEVRKALASPEPPAPTAW